MMQGMTTLGLSERLERVLAYSFFWISGIILFVVEKNRNVRWHAAQSMITFGGLSLIMFAVNMLKFTLGWNADFRHATDRCQRRILLLRLAPV